jgi:uncharacterized protein (DUF1330 family)
MSAYLIFTHDKTLDEQELAAYSKDVPGTLAGHEAKVLALYGTHEHFEGASTEGTVILEFPSMDAAKAWYDGSEGARASFQRSDISSHVNKWSLKKSSRAAVPDLRRNYGSDDVAAAPTQPMRYSVMGDGLAIRPRDLAFRGVRELLAHVRIETSTSEREQMGRPRRRGLRAHLRQDDICPTEKRRAVYALCW